MLGLGKIDRNMALMLQSAKRLETLETLDISCIYVPKQNEHYALDLLAKAPRFFFVKTLIIKGHSTYFPTRVVREHAAHFPFLNTLRLRRYFPTANRLRRLRETRILRHVHTFDPGPLCFDGRVQEQWEAILKIKLPKNVHTLDLSGLHIQNASSRANTMQEVIEHVFTTLASSDLLEHIETLHLGKWLDDDTATRTLDQHGATLTL